MIHVCLQVTYHPQQEITKHTYYDSIHTELVLCETELRPHTNATRQQHHHHHHRNHHRHTAAVAKQQHSSRDSSSTAAETAATAVVVT